MPSIFDVNDYTTLRALSEDRGVFLLRRKSDGKEYVLKQMEVYHRAIFERLMAAPVEGTPAIAAVSEENDMLYVLEQYIPGESLERQLEYGRVFSDHEAFVLCEQLCTIVSRLHKAKPAIIHRDIKPSNIMITPQGEVFLIDFNAAREDRGRESQDTELIGTPGYAAPEQYGFGSSGPAADIYALGVVLNKLLTGALPRERMPEQKACRRLVEKAIRMDPGKRYRSAEEMGTDLKKSAAASGCAGPDGRWGFRWFMMQHGLPGFRTLTWWKMIPAVLFYGLLLLVLALETFLCISGDSSFGEVLFALALIWFALSFVFFYCNYHGFRDKMPLVKNCRRIVWKLIMGTLLLFAADYILLLLAGSFYHPASVLPGS